MKVLIVAFGLVFVPALIAQEQEPTARSEESSQATRSASAAPKLGHPLDPADVDVLTGKDKASRNVYGRYAYGGSAYMYGYGYGRGSSPSIAADVTTRTSSPVSLAVSRNGRAAIVVGNAPFGGLLRGPRVCSRGVFGRGGLF